MTDIGKANDADKRSCASLYKSVKQNIVYDRDHISRLLDTDIMQYFYTDADIEKMRSKYTVV